MNPYNSPQSPHESGLTCTHRLRGLCATCESEYDADPSDWVEFGEHPDGIERTRQLEAEIAADPPATPSYGDDVPL